MGDDGICRTVAKANAEVDLKAAQQNTRMVETFYQNKQYPILIDSNKVKYITREARSHFSTKNRQSVINSMAIIVKSPISRVIGNFFMGLNKPNIPAKLFENESSAVAWLQSYLH